MNKKISEIEFTVFDVETTGLEVESGDRIIEIAAVKIKDNKKVAEYQSLVNPGNRQVSPGAFAVNQISADMLKHAPDIHKVMPAFLNFISGSCLAAYNAAFDLRFLSSALKLINKQVPEELQVVDVLKMARRMLSGLESYSLWFVANRLGINRVQEHRALSDVKMTLEVFQKFNAILTKNNIVNFEQYVSLFGLNSKLLENINNTKIACIQRALDLGVSLKIKYLAGHNAEFTEREVVPKEIIQDKNHTFLVGFCNLRNQERTFNIKNILHLEMGIPSRMA